MTYDSNPLVSIGLPVRNGAKTLEKALYSLSNQTYKNIELIISNNNSDDETEIIINKMINLFSNVNYIKQHKTLPSIKNLEAVYLKAKGEYLIFASDDDLRDPNYIETLLKGYVKYPDSSVIFSDLVFFSDYDTYKTENVSVFDFQTNGLTTFKKLRTHFNGPFHIYGLIKTKYLSKFKWYNIVYGPDHPLLFHLLAQGDFNYIPGSKFYFRKQGNAKTLEERANLYSLREIDSFYKHKLAVACTGTMIPFMNVSDLLWKPFIIFFYLYYHIKGGIKGILMWWK